MEEVYANIDDVQTLSSKSSTTQEGPRIFLRASVLGLGLLSVFLLAGLIGLAVYYYDLTEERDRLKASLTEKTSEVYRLECLTDKNTTCAAGWRKYACSCYLLSTEKASWEQSKHNCTASGADLVIGNSDEEQELITTTIKESTWIGNMEMGEWISTDPDVSGCNTATVG